MYYSILIWSDEVLWNLFINFYDLAKSWYHKTATKISSINFLETNKFNWSSSETSEVS